MRVRSRGAGRWFAIGAALLAAAGAGAAERPLAAEAERVVSQYKNVMEQPPSRVPSRDTVDGPLLGNGDLGAVISGAPELQKYWISKNNFWRLKDGHRQGGPRLFGGLDVELPALKGASYRVEQELYSARTTSRFGLGATNVTLRSWVPASDDVLLVELAAEGAPVAGRCRIWPAAGRGSTERTNAGDDVYWVTKAFTNDVRIPTAAAAAMKVLGQKGFEFTLQPGKPVTIAVAVQSSFDAADPLAAAQAKLATVTPGRIQELAEQHRQWWRNFWAESLVEIGDPVLEQAYYAANHMMAAGTREKDFPTGLFSLWVTHDDPRWAGDYHLNFDYQSQFYGLYKNNHLEQADTYDQPILDFIPRGKEYAQQVLNVRGVYYCVGIGAKGIDTCKQGNRNNASYQNGGCFMGQKCNAAYSVIPMSMRWYHTYDPEYAKRVYPFVIEVANFWEDYLRFEPAGTPTPTNLAAMPPVVTIEGVPVNRIPVEKLPAGRYVIYCDSIQENSGSDMNSIMSLGLVRNAFETVLDMSKEMGVDAERRARWEHILKNLSALPTYDQGGKTVFRYTEKGTEWVEGNSCGLQHIYPSGVVGLDDDPKLLEIARNTINGRGRKWDHDNGENSHYPAAVRVGYDPEAILAHLRILWTDSRRQANGFPDTMEQCSTVPETINQMICMSHRQVLRLFPVWPKNKDARFRNLRAEGAFLVSSELKGGAVQFVKILSEKGRDLTFVNPWPGKDVDVYRDGRKAESLKGERIVMKTKAGDTFVLVTQGAAKPDSLSL